MENSLVSEFIQSALARMEENTRKFTYCLNTLSEEELWRRPNAASNSAGNLVLHLCGNIRQYIISSLGGEKDQRNRDHEFAARDGHNRAQLEAMLTSTVAEALAVIRGLDAAALLKVRSVQGSTYTGLANVLHIVEHYSYHTGQVAFWTKQLKNRDLGFYSGVDLNKLNTD